MRSKPRIGILGVGPMAANHAKALNAVPGLDLVLSVSREAPKAAKFAAEHGIPNSCSLEELQAGPNVDGLYVVVPAASMLEVSIALAALGLPLMLEKPVGLTPEETRRAAATIQVPNMVGLNRRFYEVIRQGKDWIDQHGGATGIEIQMPEDIRLLGDRYGRNVLNTWMFGNSVHLIDLFRYFCGEPERVLALQRTGDFFDRSVAASLAFENGALGVFHTHWAAPGGWRLTVSAHDTQLIFQPIEKAMVLKRGEAAQEWNPHGPDRTYKAGLYAQAEAFAALLMNNKLAEGAADLHDYQKSVELVSSLFGFQSDDSGMLSK